MKKIILIASILFLLLPIVKGQETILNPVIPGFNPDPCIVRVGSDYYIVTSTFEWFPGIPIYHSKDLQNWTQLGHVLTRKSQLDLTGTSDSNGIFAPSITYHNGMYYVMYTVVREGINWPTKGYPNDIGTATNPQGPWSEPVLINGLGFDPSLFIDGEKAYILVRLFDHRKGKSSSPGIGIHEIDLKTLQPTGEPRFIYSGWNKQSAEGSKMIKKGDYYYLFTAEGGTGYGHYEAVARSRSVWGPYERAPEIFYSSKDNPKLPIQKAGHRTIFDTPEGEWYTTHLGSRPFTERGNCTLGRETFIQKVEWTADGWPQLYKDKTEPKTTVIAPKGLKVKKQDNSVIMDNFNRDALNVRYQLLREPASEGWLSLSRNEGYLSLRGRHILGTLYDQSFVAQRVTSHNQEFETCLEFSPTNFRHSAGIACYYDSKHYYALGLTYDEDLKSTVLELTEVDKQYKELLDKKISIPNNQKVYMKVVIDGYKLQFYYSLDHKQWNQAGSDCDFGKISDDYAGGFTGAITDYLLFSFSCTTKYSFDFVLV